MVHTVSDLVSILLMVFDRSVREGQKANAKTILWPYCRQSYFEYRRLTGVGSSVLPSQRIPLDCNFVRIFGSCFFLWSLVSFYDPIQRAQTGDEAMGIKCPTQVGVCSIEGSFTVQNLPTRQIRTLETGVQRTQY